MKIVISLISSMENLTDPAAPPEHPTATTEESEEPTLLDHAVGPILPTWRLTCLVIS